jgi:hypothetical protein
MKKYLISLIILTLLFPLTISAIKFANPLKSDNFWCMVDGIIGFIFNVSIGLGVIIYIIAGYFFVTSLGQAEKISMAKKIVLWTTIGIFIVFLAKGFIILILGFAGSTIGPINCP